MAEKTESGSTSKALSPASSISSGVLESLKQSGVILTDGGLVFKETLPFGDYCKIIQMFSGVENVSANFFRACMGDAYNQIRAKHGEKEAQCEEVFGKGVYNRIRQYAWVFGQSSLFSTPQDRVKCLNAPYEALRLLRGASPSLQHQWKKIIQKGEGVSVARIELDVKAEKAAQKQLELEAGEDTGKEPAWPGGAFGSVGDAAEKEAAAEKPETQVIKPEVVVGEAGVPSLSDEDTPEDIAVADNLDLPLPAGQSVEYVAVTLDEMAQFRAAFAFLTRDEPGLYPSVDRMVGAYAPVLFNSLVVKGVAHPDAWLDFKRKERKNGYQG